MSVKMTSISYLATLAILFAGAAAADSHEPVPDMKEQEKTEKMLKEQKALMKKGTDRPVELKKAPVPDMEKQEKTEKMVKERQAEMKEGTDQAVELKKAPVPDMEKQEKTEQMIKEQDAKAKEGL